MATKPKPRERLHLPTLILDERTLSGRDGNAVDAVLGDTRSSAPLRVLLERRSDVRYIEELHRSLCAEGLAESKATDALYNVVNMPGLAIRRSQQDPQRADVLQAVAIDDRGDDGFGRMILVATAAIRMGKPPQVESSTVNLLPLDWGRLDDRCALAVELEAWWRTYEARPTNPFQPYEDAPTSCGWFGVPDYKNYREVPNGWETSLSTLAAILGMRLYVAQSPREAAAQALHERVDFAIILNGNTGWEGIRSQFSTLEKDLLECGAPGTTFEELLASARRIIISYVFDCIQPPQPELRELRSGEVIYHRKISPQPRKFDRFDQGSAIACRHGPDGFVRWTGDKAVKGMQRIYSNFDAKMLYHCSKFPACGVYAVKG